MQADQRTGSAHQRADASDARGVRPLRSPEPLDDPVDTELISDTLLQVARVSVTSGELPAREDFLALFVSRLDRAQGRLPADALRHEAEVAYLAAMHMTLHLLGRAAAATGALPAEWLRDAIEHAA